MILFLKTFFFCNYRDVKRAALFLRSFFSLREILFYSAKNRKINEQLRKLYFVSPLLFFFAINLILLRKEQKDKRATKKISLCFFAPFFLCVKPLLDYTSIKRMVSFTTACKASGNSDKSQG